MNRKKNTEANPQPARPHCTIYGHTWQQTLTQGVRICSVCGKMGQCPACRPALVLNVQVAYCFRHGEGV